MTLAQGLAVGALFVGFVYWLLASALSLRAAWTMPVLRDLRPSDPARWPSLSVVIPACNEADTIESALRSRLTQDYPELEVVVVEDRSTDATASIVDRIAAEDPRLRALHIKELPPGWLGKLHALHRGAEAASGEWLLFTDADVHFAPETLRRAVAYCEERELDFLTAMPEFLPGGLLLDVPISVFVRNVAMAAQARAVEDPASKIAVGGGVFNLVRRSAFEKTPGFSYLKLEIADDVSFGQMMKRAGARCSVVNARGMIRLKFYESLGAMARGCEKAGFAVLGRFSHARLVAVTLLYLGVELSPFAALAPLGIPWLPALGALMIALSLGSTALVNRSFGRSALPALLSPIGSVLMAGFFLRSGYLAWRRGGVAWRGTLYPTDLLRDGVRFEPPWGGRPS
jgi:hypothetical protein